MTGSLVAAAFLVVALAALTQYAHAYRLLRGTTGPLVRTAASRIGVACLYVALGAAGLVAGDRLPAWVPLAVFTATQVVWWRNSRADVRHSNRGNS
ncbi:MAG: hypothetical protein NVSMB4_02650 [Acidimicrobiales bacterium]